MWSALAALGRERKIITILMTTHEMQHKRKTVTIPSSMGELETSFELGDGSAP